MSTNDNTQGQPGDRPGQSQEGSSPTTVYEAVGGSAVFERIVKRFYSAVEHDPVLRPMYPADLKESKRTLAGFLIQYFGGPSTYSQERGHPRLRMRHAPYSIGQSERDAWLRHMRAAVEAEALPTEICDVLQRYFEQASTFMMNRHSEAP